jgi:hypothetical protein
METICDDIPPSPEALQALTDVLEVLSEDFDLPEPEILYSSKKMVELTWKTVGILIEPPYIVMFRPVLEKWEKFDFEFPQDKEALKKAVLSRLTHFATYALA